MTSSWDGGIQSNLYIYRVIKYVLFPSLAVLLVPGHGLPFTLVKTKLFQICNFNTQEQDLVHFDIIHTFCATCIILCRTYNFLFFKPQSHIHDFVPSRATIHPGLSNRDASA